MFFLAKIFYEIFYNESHFSNFLIYVFCSCLGVIKDRLSSWLYVQKHDLLFLYQKNFPTTKSGSLTTTAYWTGGGVDFVVCTTQNYNLFYVAPKDFWLHFPKGGKNSRISINTFVLYFRYRLLFPSLFQSVFNIEFNLHYLRYSPIEAGTEPEEIANINDLGKEVYYLLLIILTLDGISHRVTTSGISHGSRIWKYAITLLIIFFLDFEAFL